MTRLRFAWILLSSVRVLCAEPPEDLSEFVHVFAEDYGSLSRLYDMELSAERRSRMRRFYTGERTELEKHDFQALERDGRVDYLLLKNLLTYEQRQLDEQERRASEMERLIPFAAGIAELHEIRQRKQLAAPSEAASVLDRLNRGVADLQEDVEQLSKTPEPVVNRAVKAIASLRETLKSWYEFRAGYDPLFTWWVEAPYKRLDKSLDEYGKLLREKVLGLKPDDDDTIVGDPIGGDALLVELASEMIPYSPEELIEIGEKEYAWCEREMRRASRDLGFGDDWLRALEHVKTLHVEPGKQPELIRRQAEEAVEFIEKRNLVTVPPLAVETWRMTMMTPERQRVNPFFTGGEVISVSFPTSGMTHEEKLMSMRGNNVHFSRATVQHELIPGHHLQLFMNARYRPYRRAFRTPFWIEGWALWWELLLWDLDFPQSPENRIGMLFWRMHRCARIVFSLSFHLGKMSAEECIDYLVNRVGHERENAAAEVRRSFTGDYSPLYQCAYLLGGLQLRALHRELVASGRMSNREFHNAILRLGPIPIEMVRASLTEQELTPGYTANWRFYEE